MAVKMEWAAKFRKEQEKIKKAINRETEKKVLGDLKKKHFLEKKQEIDQLKKRLAFLEKEIESYK